MHIVFVIRRMQTGGAERQVSYLSSYLASKEGFRVTVLFFGDKDPVAAKWFSDPKVQLISTGFTEKLILPRQRTLATLFRMLRYRKKLIHIVKGLNPDILLPFTYTPNVIFGLLWRHTKAKKCIWNQRDAGLEFVNRSYEVKAARNCSAWISNSKIGATFLNSLGIMPVHIIPNAVLNYAKKNAGLSAPLRVVMIGNINAHKDHLTLLKAWKLVTEQMKQGSIELVLAGRFGNRYQEVADYIKANNLEKSVLLPGVVEDIPALLESCHVSVFSSPGEGMPNGILEPMSFGLPVVSSRIEGAIDLLGTDYPFFGTTEQELANHMMSLLHSPELRHHTGMQNLDRVKKLYSLEVSGDRMQEVILGVLNQ